LERGVRLHDRYQLERLRLVARLLAQLPSRRLDRRLSRIDDASRHLQRQRIAAEPVLPDEHQLAGVGLGEHVAPVGRREHEDVVRQRRRVGDALHLEHAAVVGHRIGAPPLEFDQPARTEGIG